MPKRLFLEKDFYEENNVSVHYVGHPLLPVIDTFQNKNEVVENSGEKRVFAVLPGSRKQEVSKKLPIMLEAMKGRNGYQIVIAGAPSLSKEFYAALNKEVKIIHGETYELLANAEAAVVTSGTATLKKPMHPTGWRKRCWLFKPRPIANSMA